MARKIRNILVILLAVCLLSLTAAAVSANEGHGPHHGHHHGPHHGHHGYSESDHSGDVSEDDSADDTTADSTEDTAPPTVIVIVNNENTANSVASAA